MPQAVQALCHTCRQYFPTKRTSFPVPTSPEFLHIAYNPRLSRKAFQKDHVCFYKGSAHGTFPGVSQDMKACQAGGEHIP